MKELEQLIELRKELHKYPEVSGNEKDTAERIIDFLTRYPHDKLLKNIGGSGLAFIYDSGNPGPSVLFRCELDALPIEESNNFEHRSVFQGVSHKCGHDGHMAILAGLGIKLAHKRPKKGRVILLFQPSEENGAGAEMVIKDSQYEEIKPDFVFALHNLPGFKRHTIITNPEIFSSASCGMIVKLKGKTAHAGEPENGINPAPAVAEMINSLLELPQKKELFDGFTLLTIIHIRLGEVAFGTSAGYAEVMATLRSFTNEDMHRLKEEAFSLSSEIAGKNELEFELDWVEEFLATENDVECNDLVEKSAEAHRLEIIRRNEPFRWSEDFSHFLLQSKGALFGLGSGENHPMLHNPDYDFPDENISTGIKMFESICRGLLG